MKMVSAAERVFGIEEMREQILSKLTFYDLFTAQRVCRSWRDSIKGFCGRLQGFNDVQEAIFLKPRPAQCPDRPLWLDQPLTFDAPTNAEAATLIHWEFNECYHNHEEKVLCRGCSPLDDGLLHPIFRMEHLNPILRDNLTAGVCWRAIGDAIIFYTSDNFHLERFMRWCDRHKTGSWLDTLAFQPSVRKLVIARPLQGRRNEQWFIHILWFRCDTAMQMKHFLKPFLQADWLLPADRSCHTVMDPESLDWIIDDWRRMRYNRWWKPSRSIWMPLD
ncbi:hypothetical protein BU16DRAFT_257118 [Lophium mytilinum]|uniref:F-box domain-containing protein n=1 Tax=Lophium mytilinum TaxID=390894 RepID=A0A6A6R8F0_9PEZI|nr:hypothetical protein BU16DRAFT_257118 [Lophium mytilinum]